MQRRRVSSIAFLLKPQVAPRKNTMDVGKGLRSKVLAERNIKFPEKSRGVLSPHTFHKMVWDGFMLVCTCYVMVVTPFELTFISDQECSPRSPLFAPNAFINGAFVLDMLLCLNTSYLDERLRQWVIDRRLIAKRYLYTWFLCDGISIIPFECIGQTRGLTYARLARSLRFFKLLKVLKSPRVLQAISMHWDFSSKLQATFKYVLLLLFTVHWSACALRLLTLLACDYGDGPHTRGRKSGALLDSDSDYGTCPNTVLTTGGRPRGHPPLDARRGFEQ